MQDCKHKRYRSDIFFDGIYSGRNIRREILNLKLCRNLSFKTNSLFTQTPQVCFRLWRFRFVKFVFRLLLSRQSRQLECICCWSIKFTFFVNSWQISSETLTGIDMWSNIYVWLKVPLTNIITVEREL
jgi:hypothetical protein